MNNKKAIKLIYGIEEDGRNVTSEHVEALKLAIKALEADRWIPVSERLPDNSENEGQLCERVSVMTRYGVTEGWYNPDFKTWFVLVWYMGRTFDNGTGDIDFKRADNPKVVDDVEVIAWKPLPKSYESEDK